MTNRSQAIEHNDSLAYPQRMPNGEVIWASQMACNYEGCIGTPVFRVTLFQEHFFMINAGMVTMFPGSRTERDVFD